MEGHPEMSKCIGGGRGAGKSGRRWSLSVSERTWGTERPEKWREEKCCEKLSDRDTGRLREEES